MIDDDVVLVTISFPEQFLGTFFTRILSWSGFFVRNNFVLKVYIKVPIAISNSK